MIYTIPVDPFGDLMTISDWVKSVACGAYIDYDGYGYPAKDGMQTSEPLSPSQVGSVPNDATHFVWYNR